MTLNGPSNGIPVWTCLWFLVSGIICTWDATFIMFRPQSLPGGKYSQIWKPYGIYVEVDKRYADLDDPFVYAQSLMNLVEIALGFVVIILNFRNAASTAALAVSTSLLTMWKTVCYLIQYTDLCGGGKYHSHNDARTNFLFLWLPSAIWIIIPLLVVLRLWGRISGGREESGSKEVSRADIGRSKMETETPGKTKQRQKNKKNK